jgi:hypothetical protein
MQYYDHYGAGVTKNNTYMERLGFEDLREFMDAGVFYAPASRHYPEKPGISVSCDQCGARNLLACIGLRQQDLCLTCAHRAAATMQAAAATAEDPAFLRALVGLTVAEAQARVETMGLRLRAVPLGAIVHDDYRSDRLNATTDMDRTVILAVGGRW